MNDLLFTIQKELMKLGSNIGDESVYSLYKEHIDHIINASVDNVNVNDLIEEFAAVLDGLLMDLTIADEVNSKLEDSNYAVYMDNQAKIELLYENFTDLVNAIKPIVLEGSTTRNPHAMLIFGIIYEYGICSEKNITEAIAYYERAAFKKISLAEVKLTKYYYSKEDYVKCVYWAQKATEHGSIDASAIYGKLLYYGNGTDINYVKAYELLSKFEGGPDNAINSILGECYYYGRGTDVDYEKSCSILEKIVDVPHSDEIDLILAKCYEMTQNDESVDGIYCDNGISDKKILAYRNSADKGNIEAILFLANDLSLGQERYSYLERAAELGDIDSIRKYAEACEAGEIVGYNTYSAIKWYEQLAANGDEQVAFKLGELFEKGIKVAENPSRSYLWYLKAAEWGNMKAQEKVAYFFENGYGVEKNIQESIKWLQSAANLGSQDAQKSIGIKCYNAGNYDSAFVYLSAASSSRDDEVNYLLGECFLNGYGTPANPDKAIQYFWIAAEYGSCEAQTKVGLFYEKAEKYDQAIKWYEIARDNGSLEAKFLLALMKYNGKGFNQDLVSAVKEVGMVALDGYPQAQYWMGFFYENGIGFNVNYKNAVVWYIEAHRNGVSDALNSINSIKAKLLSNRSSIGAYNMQFSYNNNSNMNEALKILNDNNF